MQQQSCAGCCPCWRLLLCMLLCLSVRRCKQRIERSSRAPWLLGVWSRCPEWSGVKLVLLATTLSSAVAASPCADVRHQLWRALPADWGRRSAAWWVMSAALTLPWLTNLLHSGPKDLPVLARGAGLVTGRAAAWLASARAKFAQFSKEAELTEARLVSTAADMCCRGSQSVMSQLHEELNQSMRELRTLRSELRGGVNLWDPGSAPCAGPGSTWLSLTQASVQATGAASHAQAWAGFRAARREPASAGRSGATAADSCRICSLASAAASRPDGSSAGQSWPRTPGMLLLAVKAAAGQ